MYLRYIGLLTITILLEEVVSIRYNPEITGVANEGIFERFVRNLFDLLSSPVFPGKKLVKLCKIFHKETTKIKTIYGKKLAKRFRRMARMDRDEVKDELQEYRKMFDNKLPARTAFLKAMNDVFTLRENLLFDDYIYDLRDYGTDDKLSVRDETRRLVHDVIIRSVHKMGARDQIDIENKLRKAIVEADDEVDEDFLSFIEKIKIDKMTN